MLRTLTAWQVRPVPNASPWYACGGRPRRIAGSGTHTALWPPGEPDPADGLSGHGPAVV